VVCVADRWLGTCWRDPFRPAGLPCSSFRACARPLLLETTAVAWAHPHIAPSGQQCCLQQVRLTTAFTATISKHPGWLRGSWPLFCFLAKFPQMSPLLVLSVFSQGVVFQEIRPKKRAMLLAPTVPVRMHSHATPGAVGTVVYVLVGCGGPSLRVSLVELRPLECHPPHTFGQNSLCGQRKM
jgi:hypothetical protein